MRAESNVNGARVTMHIVSSLDGFIASNDNSIGWWENAWSNYEAGKVD